MKITRFILCLVLIAGTVASQPAPQLDSLAVAVVEQVGAVAGTVVTHEINRAYLQVTTSYPAYEVIDTVTIDSASGRVALPANYDRMIAVDLIVSGGDLDKVRVSLRKVPTDTTAADIVREKMDYTNAADQKYYQVSARYLYTYPRWTRTDTASFEVRYYAVGAKLTSGSDTITVAFAYRNAVFFLACAEYQARRGQFRDAAFYQALCEQRYGPLIRRRDEE